jgi:hypothetical protein
MLFKYVIELKLIIGFLFFKIRMSEKEKDQHVIEIKEPKEEINNPNNNTNKDVEIGFLKSPVVLFISVAISSIGMTIFNKRLSKAYPHPFLLISIQNFASVLLFILFQFVSKEIFPIKELKLSQFKTLFIPTIGYSLILWTSLEGLSRVSIALIIVFRNVTPLFVSIIETVMNNKPISLEESFSLVLVFVGSLGYALSDFT